MAGQRKVGHAGTLDPMATGCSWFALGKQPALPNS
jgi:tRNA U55 pseudouridine synthase TruB